MPKMKPLTGKEMIKLLKENGFELDRIEGSHHIMIKENLIASVPAHGSKTLKIGTQNSILKDAGLK